MTFKLVANVGFVFAIALVPAPGHRGSQAGAAETDLAAIERLHQQDIAATAPGDPALLANLWTEDAIRINPDGKADIGLKAIRAADERSFKRHPEARILSYAPKFEDLRVAGDWAFEWGHFTADYKDSPAGEVKTFHGTILRVLQKQRDGSWKFARVMTQGQ